MATASPMLCNNSNETGSTLPVNNGSLMPQQSILIDTPRQNLHGLNKPKCIKCGNVARSSLHLGAERRIDGMLPLVVLNLHRESPAGCGLYSCWSVTSSLMWNPWNWAGKIV
ncbi:hypothetical protein QJS04_geneDACA008712 [Acorus gramineus]|uniref:Uncharacterized protein n=1 Tax=Acorus gramineus TaxID=55184 RepID=A0AAV9AC13_ACOGR|nr:hypothetical protein QJS04_geneDACA008712 [Acorus gramineus]